MEKLENIDRNLVLLVNGAHNDFLDTFFWVVSKPYLGIPFYLLFLFFLYKSYGIKNMFWILLGCVVAVALSDLSAKYLFKEMFLRYRPSHNLLLKDKLHFVNDYRGGMYGFVSSHAANMAAVGSMVFFFLKGKVNRIGWLIVLFVFLVAYSRVYLGVHYVSDVLVGALLGFFLAFLVYRPLRIFVKA